MASFAPHSHAAAHGPADQMSYHEGEQPGVQEVKQGPGIWAAEKV